MPPDPMGMPVHIFDDADESSENNSEGTVAPDQTPTPVVVKEAPKVSQVELDARGDGWINKEEWIAQGKDPEEHVSAREYIRAGEMIARIRNQNNQLGSFREELKQRNQRLDALEKTLHDLVDHNKKLTSSQMNQAKQDLYQARAEALVEQDSKRIAELDTAIDDLRNLENLTPDEPRRPEEPGDPEPVIVDPRYDQFTSWTNRPENDWFKEDPVRRGAFISLGDQVAEEFGEGANLNDILDEAKKRLVKEFPAKFSGERPPPTSSNVLEENSAGGSANTSSGYTMSDLTEEQLTIAKTFAREGIMSVQEYVDQLAGINGIEK